jgi:hypothetical protein
MQLSTDELSKAAKRLWRILVGMALGQVLGLLLMRVLDFPSSMALIPAMSSQDLQQTIGASLGTVAGFLLGAAWHKASAQGQDTRYVLALGLLSVVASFPGVIFLVASMA